MNKKLLYDRLDKIRRPWDVYDGYEIHVECGTLFHRIFDAKTNTVIVSCENLSCGFRHISDCSPTLEGVDN